MIEEECGIQCGKVKTVMLRLPGNKTNTPAGWTVQAKLSIFLWLGIIQSRQFCYSGLPKGFDLSPEIRNAERIGALAPSNIHYLEKHVSLELHVRHLFPRLENVIFGFLEEIYFAFCILLSSIVPVFCSFPPSFNVRKNVPYSFLENTFVDMRQSILRKMLFFTFLLSLLFSDISIACPHLSSKIFDRFGCVRFE